MEVLLAEVGATRTGDGEQLGDDGGDAVEVAWAARALHTVGYLGHVDRRQHGAARVHLLHWRSEDHRCAFGLGHGDVAVEIAGISRQVLVGAELQRIHEHGDRGDVALSSRAANQRGVPLVQIPHRRHQTDGLAVGSGRVELLAEPFDAVKNLHQRTSAFSTTKRLARSTLASYAGSSEGSSAARWRCSVSTSPRAAGPVSDLAGPRGATFSTGARTRSRNAS